MEFNIVDNGKIINCKIILTFKDTNNNINYIVYTDGTKNFNDELEIYASRYELKDNNYILKDIQNDYEWNLIDNMLNSKYEENY